MFRYQSPEPTRKTMKAAVKSTEAHAAWDENGSEAPIWSDPTTHRSQND